MLQVTDGVLQEEEEDKQLKIAADYYTSVYMKNKYTILLSFLVLILNADFLSAQGLKTLTETDVVQMFPGSETFQNDTASLLNDIVLYSSPDTSPRSIQFQVAIPKNWDAITRDTLKLYFRDTYIIRLASFISNDTRFLECNITAIPLGMEINYQDFLEAFAVDNGFFIVKSSLDIGANGELYEILGVLKNSIDDTPLFSRLSALRDGENIFVIVSGVAPLDEFKTIARELAVITLSFKLDNPQGEKLVEKFDSVRIDTPHHVNFIYPEDWYPSKLEDVPAGKEILVYNLSYDTEDIASLFFIAVDKKEFQELTAEGEIHSTMEWLEYEGFGLIGEMKPFEIKTENFSKGYLINCDLMKNTQSYVLRYICVENNIGFYEICMIYPSPTKSSVLWMNAKRIFEIVIDSFLKNPD